MADRRIPRSWFNGPVLVEQILTPGPLGDRYDTGYNIPHAYTEDGTKLIRSGNGENVTSSTQVLLDVDWFVPVGSFVTVWLGNYKQRRSKVVAIERATFPGLMAHQVLYLE